MKPLLTFYILVFYVLLQFCWWAYLLVDLNTEVYENKIEMLKVQNPQSEEASLQTHELIRKLHSKWWMVAGEGTVFLALLVLGINRTQNAFDKEFMLARQQKNFLLSVTHEFKSPLAAIKLNLQTLQKHELDKDKQKNILSRALAETDRINNLVENALMAARIETQNIDLVLEEFNLSQCIRATIQSRIDTLSNTKKIISSIDDDVFIKGDSLALSSLLLNLMENAEKYSPEDSNIVIELKQIKNGATLKVIDEGIGVSENEKIKIFEKFYRVGNEETRRTKGTGLGLYIVKYIAGYHKAKIEVKNNSPKGTIFEIIFQTV